MEGEEGCTPFAAGCKWELTHLRWKGRSRSTFFSVGWLFSLLGRAGQGAHGAHGDPFIDVECLAGDVSAGFTGEEGEWTVEGVEGGGGRLDAGLVAHIEGEWRCFTSEERGPVQKKGTRDGCLFREEVSFSGRARLAGSRPAETPVT